MKISHRKNNIEKSMKKIGPGTLHGSILEGLGRLLGAIGALLGAMLAFLGRSWALLGRLFGLMGASDLIWEGFGRLLGGSWEVWGRILKEFWEDFGKISSFQRPPRCLANSLGVNIARGSRNPPACWITGIRASHAFWWSEAPLRGRRVSRRV